LEEAEAFLNQSPVERVVAFATECRKFAAPEHSRIDVAVVETSARALLTWLLLTFGRTPSALTQAVQEPWKACYTLVEF
jgi:hypothetical protein